MVFSFSGRGPEQCRHAPLFLHFILSCCVESVRCFHFLEEAPSDADTPLFLLHFIAALCPRFQDEATGETRIGMSYAKLCESVSPGNRILIADGTIVIEVLEILSATEVKGKVNPILASWG
jgi:Pyruvate kinase, barrel domain